jgi:hypothetical protein
LYFDYGLPVDKSAMKRVECEVHAIKELQLHPKTTEMVSHMGGDVVK